MTRREQRTGTSRSGRKRCESLASGIRPGGGRENIAALPLIEQKESLRGLMAIEVPGLQFRDYVIGGGPRFREHTWCLGLEGSISKSIDRA